MNIKKALRTVQVEFPFLLDWKFRFMRSIQLGLKIPFERDFAAIPYLSPPAGALFLDVGANRGQSTDAILMFNPNARVQLFEPNQLLFDRLRVLFNEKQNIVLHNCGLGSRPMEATLYVPFYKQWMFDGLASFDEHEALAWLHGRMYFFKKSYVRLEKSICHVRKLDDLSLAPFFIKIDVQGFELQVLQGGRSTLDEYNPVLLIETPSNEVVAFLAELGYEQHAFEGGRFHRGKRGRLNSFFITQNKAVLINPANYAATVTN